MFAALLYGLGAGMMYLWMTSDDKPSWGPYAVAIALLWPIWAALAIYDRLRKRDR